MKTGLFILLFMISFIKTAPEEQFIINSGNIVDIEDYPFTEKGRFIKDVRKDLKNVDKQINFVRKQTGIKNKAGKETERKINILKAESFELKNMMNRAEDSTESAWNKTKFSINRSFSNLKSLVDEIQAGPDDNIDQDESINRSSNMKLFIEVLKLHN